MMRVLYEFVNLFFYYLLFELFLVYVEFEGEGWGEFYGYIEVIDDLGIVFFFERVLDEFEFIFSNGFVFFEVFDFCRFVLVYGLLKFDVELYVKVSEDEYF